MSILSVKIRIVFDQKLVLVLNDGRTGVWRAFRTRDCFVVECVFDCGLLTLFSGSIAIAEIMLLIGKTLVKS